MKNWILQSSIEFEKTSFRPKSLIEILLENRDIKSKREIDKFLNPSLDSLTAKNLGIDAKQLSKTLKRIRIAIDKKEQIIIFGDYDVDGVTATAILWETLNSLGASVMPYIPHRIEEGYGLSIKGIDNLKKQYKQTSLIITVDNGIVANEAVKYANSLGIDVVVTDHHVPGKTKPSAYSIIHSTVVCGAGVAYFLSQKISSKNSQMSDDHLGFAALATVADVMQLRGVSRALVVFGLRQLRKTKRPGLVETFKLAGIEQSRVGVYEIGHIIAPRINAMGRLEHGMDSLRFLCTPNLSRATELAGKLHMVNMKRQKLTLDSFTHAKNLMKGKNQKLIMIAGKSYLPGVIGLISGKLTEEYYRPSIVFSVGKIFSKASARSVPGFNIIEFIRQAKELLVDVGGHPMAAGFTIETKNLPKLEKLFQKLAKKEIKEELLVRKLKIACKLPLEFITDSLYSEIVKLSPFGYGNPEPVFQATNVLIENMQTVGKDNKHFRFFLGDAETKIGGIAFNFENNEKIGIGDRVDVAYTISQNEWNGNKKLELKIKGVLRARSKQ